MQAKSLKGKHMSLDAGETSYGQKKTAKPLKKGRTVQMRLGLTAH
jgi:hypothetical protein